MYINVTDSAWLYTSVYPQLGLDFACLFLLAGLQFGRRQKAAAGWDAEEGGWWESHPDPQRGAGVSEEPPLWGQSLGGDSYTFYIFSFLIKSHRSCFYLFIFIHSPTGTAGGEAAPWVSRGWAGQWPPAGIREQAGGSPHGDAQPAWAADQDVQGRDREDI